MADPSIVTCTANAWTKVATNVKAGVVSPFKTNVVYSQTYRDTGNPAPTDLLDALAFDEPHMISASTGIDVYIYAHKKAGSVRVDV